MAKLLLMAMLMSVVSMGSMQAQASMNATVTQSEAQEIVEEQVLRIQEHIEILHDVALEQGDVETMKDLIVMMSQGEEIKKMSSAVEAKAAADRLAMQVYGIEAFLQKFAN